MRNIFIFFAVGITQLAVDTMLFSLMVRFGTDYVVANFISRAIAAITGFILNGRLTFRKRLSLKVFIKFWIYWSIMTALSSLLLMFIHGFIAAVAPESYVAALSKIVVEFILFFISYVIAKVWVYKK
ncbi:GtrA family protein [Erwinia sp. STN24]|uniref:GtrA family protein n=1 Tax=Erwinia sp. STN24 TaxID=3233996 RepID=UPI003521498B